MQAFLRRALAGVYYCGLVALLFSAGGLLCLAALDEPGPAAEDSHLHTAAVTAIAAAITVAGSGAVLVRRNRKRLLFGTILCIGTTGLALGVGELLSRRFVPPWPAGGLHGVDPAQGMKAWGRTAADDAIGFNNWGQRDRPRTMIPAAETVRIAFVGDSFLEESTTVPLSLRVEEKLRSTSAGRQVGPPAAASPAVEVINLGVSATGPDEYYDRIRAIALPLGARHCVLFLFSGNDFVEPPRSLESVLGIVAVYPRSSLFSTLGLRGLNHLLTNNRRPVLQAWFAAGDLGAREGRLARLLREADDATARQYLLGASGMGVDERSRLAARLNKPENERFLAVLRNPDQGLFRSYYLSAGLWSAANPGEQWEHNSEEHAYFWIRKAEELCRRQGIGFTLAIIPEAFQVDSRMQQQWQPLADMRHLTAPCREAARRLRWRAEADGLDVVDLHDVLQDVPGTYLNLDGHWSDRGVEVVAEALAERLRGRL
jgi:hypothetical protein